jgi:hypothetical protein
MKPQRGSSLGKGTENTLDDEVIPGLAMAGSFEPYCHIVQDTSAVAAERQRQGGVIEEALIVIPLHVWWMGLFQHVVIDVKKYDVKAGIYIFPRWTMRTSEFKCAEELEEKKG